MKNALLFILIIFILLFTSCTIQLSSSLLTITNICDNAVDIKVTSPNSKSMRQPETQSFSAPEYSSSDNTTDGLVVDITSYDMKSWQIDWDPTFNKSIEATMECNGIKKTITIENMQKVYYEFNGTEFKIIVFAN